MDIVYEYETGAQGKILSRKDDIGLGVILRNDFSTYLFNLEDCDLPAKTSVKFDICPSTRCAINIKILGVCV